MAKKPNALKQVIFFSGNHYFQALLADIAAAEKSIDLETYIFNLDALGEEVSKALIDAAQRNVKIRILVDGAGTRIWSGGHINSLEQAGIQTRIFHPFPWKLLHWSHSRIQKNFLSKALYLLTSINSRNHRKVCIIDKKIAYIGSFNISKVHLSSDKEGSDWRDTAVKLSGVNLKKLQNAFNIAWEHLPIQERIQAIFKPITRDPIIRLNYTRHLRRALYKNLLNRIKRCKKRLWMVNAYFVPDNRLLKKLQGAAESGIDVRIVLPQKSDIFFMPLASSAFYRSLLKSGVRIFEYLPSMLHAKTLIIDDWMTVGSSNFNHRSLLHDLEVDVNIRVPAAKEAIEKQFLEDLKNSQEIQLPDWQKRPWYQRFLARLLLYTKYWI